jgi:hypothetical protein
VVSKVKQRPQGTLCGLGSSDVQGQEAREARHDAQVTLPDIPGQTVVPKGFNSEASQNKQADDRHARECVINMMDIAKKRQAKNQLRRNDAKGERDG